MADVLEGMRKDSPLYKALSSSGQEQAAKAARLLQGFLDNQKVPPKVAECGACRARLENPHADYMMPAPQIDADKI